MKSNNIFCAFLLMSLLWINTMTLNAQEKYTKGDIIQDFTLQTIEKVPFKLMEQKSNIIVIVFWGNSCPYVKMYQSRILSFYEKNKVKGVEMIAINSNDIKKSEEDNYEKSREYKKEHKLSFPFLKDTKEHTIAKKFNAIKTPEFFVLKKVSEGYKLVYKGSFDNHIVACKATTNYLQEAVNSILSGKNIVNPETSPTGCNIKWAE